MQKSRHPVLAIRSLTGLDKSVFDILARAKDRPPTQNEISGKLGGAASQSSVSRSIARLTAEGLVEKFGTKRFSQFKVTPEALWFSLPPHARPPVPFDPNRIGDYFASRSSWLPAGAAARMKAAAPARAPSIDAATFSREIAERFMIDLAYASSALEGNTYSHLETEVLIKYGESAGGRTAEEATMILNHKAAIGWVIEEIDRIRIEPDTAMRLHALLMRGLVRHDNAGAVRRHAVGISGSAYEPTVDGSGLAYGLAELCSAVSMREDPFEASFGLLAGLAYLQTFADGNKRLGRVMASIPLLKQGLAPLSFVGVDRSVYSAGMLSWYELADPKPLADAIAEGYETSAPAYAVAHAVKRVPRGIEIRERQRTNQVLADYLRAYVEGERTEPFDFAVQRFHDLALDDTAHMATYISEVVEALNESSAIAYGIDRGLYASYVAARDQPSP
jgi:hypothetical protein